MEVLTTPRLRLREWQSEDFAAICNILMDAKTMHHWPAPLEEEAVQIWLNRNITQRQTSGYTRWCCERLADGQIVGDVGLVDMTMLGREVIDLGYIIHADYWGIGLGLEAALGVVDWAKRNRVELNIETLVATMATDNLPSVAVAKKLGMELIRSFENPKNVHKQTYYFELNLDS